MSSRDSVRGMRLASLLVVILGGCGEPAPAEPDAAPPPRTVQASLALSATGISEPLDFNIPAGTRSITVIARGQDTALYALGSFTLGGTERVGLDLSTSQAAVMEDRYFTEEIGQMPGDLYQVVRLGTFTQVYPYAPGQEVPAGPGQLRLLSNTGAGSVDVVILMPPEDAAASLHVNIIAASENVTLTEPVPFLDEVNGIFAQAGIEVVVDQVVNATGTGLSAITEFTEPQEAPGSMSAELALLGQTLVDSDALNVFIVDSLPLGVGGLSLGTPGPPDPDSYYYGVILRQVADEPLLARVFAHEVAHFLALHHVENRSLSGDLYGDPLDDTEPGSANLMESGTTITAGQSFALSRSALLTVD